MPAKERKDDRGQEHTPWLHIYNIYDWFLAWDEGGITEAHFSTSFGQTKGSSVLQVAPIESWRTYTNLDGLNAARERRMKDEGRRKICWDTRLFPARLLNLIGRLPDPGREGDWLGGPARRRVLGRGSELREKEERRRQWQDGYESVCVAGGRARVLVNIVGFSGFGIQPQGNVEHRCPTADTRWVNWKEQGSVCWCGWPWWNVGQYYLISRHIFGYPKIIGFY